MGIIMDFPSYWQGQRNFKKSKQQQKKKPVTGQPKNLLDQKFCKIAKTNTFQGVLG